jgi:hypothetical protein
MVAFANCIFSSLSLTANGAEGEEERDAAIARSKVRQGRGESWSDSLDRAVAAVEGGGDAAGRPRMCAESQATERESGKRASRLVV